MRFNADIVGKDDVEVWKSSGLEAVPVLEALCAVVVVSGERTPGEIPSPEAMKSPSAARLDLEEVECWLLVDVHLYVVFEALLCSVLYEPWDATGSKACAIFANSRPVISVSILSKRRKQRPRPQGGSHGDVLHYNIRAIGCYTLPCLDMAIGTCRTPEQPQLRNSSAGGALTSAT